MKKSIFFICLALAGSYCISMAQGYDPNYKHQAGKTPDNSIPYKSFNVQSNSGHDHNYKHQAGKKRAKRDSIVLPSGGRNRTDVNYKHQFPGR
jgi:hypothetical protein